MTPMDTNRIHRALALSLPFAVFGLIFMGALVKSHEAGLAVPDWPTTFGENMFTYPPSKWTGGVFYEHVHRLIASVIGAMTLLLTLFVWRYEKRTWVRTLTAFALLAVILQGLLGGFTVLYGLPLLVSSAHGVLAQLFFIATIVIAFSYRSKLESLTLGQHKQSRWLTLAIVATLIQLFLGALVRHSEAALAVPDFPTMGGLCFSTANLST